MKKTATNFTTKLYNASGATVSDLKLPEEVFGLPWNADLVHQVVVSQQSNRRSGTAHTKGRGDVRGGGKKPWKQKGTGRARHGSSRSPIWVGGGVSHGPTVEKSYERKVNRVMARRAFATILSRKFADGQILFVDDVTVTSGKTKDAAAMIQKFATIAGFEKMKQPRKENTILALLEKNRATTFAFRNIPAINISTVADLSALAATEKRFIIVVGGEKAVAQLSAKCAK